jgi:hypothetical protein
MSRTQPGPTDAHGTAVAVAVALVPAAATAVPSAPPPSTTDALIPAITAVLVRRLTLLNIEHPFASPLWRLLDTVDVAKVASVTVS